jgi:hypothetical protein
MGKQHNKAEKRARRQQYVKRKNARAKAPAAKGKAAPAAA